MVDERQTIVSAVAISLVCKRPASRQPPRNLWTSHITLSTCE